MLSTRKLYRVVGRIRKTGGLAELMRSRITLRNVLQRARVLRHDTKLVIAQFYSECENGPATMATTTG